jgi:hypothetical protein
MKVSAASSKDNFGCIHGIRFFSTCWVVLGHTFSIAAGRVMNRKAVTEVNQQAASFYDRKLPQKFFRILKLWACKPLATQPFQWIHFS